MNLVLYMLYFLRQEAKYHTGHLCAESLNFINTYKLALVADIILLHHTNFSTCRFPPPHPYHSLLKINYYINSGGGNLHFSKLIHRIQTIFHGDKYSKCFEDFPGGPVVKISPFSAEGAGLIPGWGVKISHSLQAKEYLKQKHYYDKFNKDC